MNDKSLSCMLIGLFGLPGLTIFLIALLEPSLIYQRALAFVVGSFGLLIAILLILNLRRKGTEKLNVTDARTNTDNY